MKLPFQWKQGEHLTITGNTGSGKTTFANVLLYARDNTLVLKSKADPAPLPGRRIGKAIDFVRGTESRYLLYPPFEHQRSEFIRALNTVWKEGGWSVYIDELFYMHKIGLEWYIDRLLTQGRSNGITVICGMQRPVGVTRYAMSQATHLVAFGAERRDVKILAEIGSDLWGDSVAQLGEHEFAWYYVPKRQVWTGKVQRLLT